MSFTGRCSNCRDGLIVILDGKTRRTVTCHCHRGRARENVKTEAQLRAELLAAYFGGSFPS